MIEENLGALKRQFREWYGSLSVEELVTNEKLIELIQKIEAYFSGLTPQGGH